MTISAGRYRVSTFHSEKIAAMESVVESAPLLYLRSGSNETEATVFLWFHKALMKRRLTIIAALASIACTGLPLQAHQKEVFDRSHVLAVMTVVQCWVKLGRITEEKGNEFLQKHTQEDIPHAKAAYEWAQNPDNDNARAAVEVLLPYLGADCEGAMSNEDLIKLLQPYLW